VVPQPTREHLPDRKTGPEGPPKDAEEDMGYVLFLVIAFVLLGAERLAARWHHPTMRHEAPPGS
jgi:hypothetical protein